VIQVDLENRVVHLDGFFGDSADGGIDGPLVREALGKLGPGDVSIWLNSPGGIVSHSAGVIAALEQHPGRITTVGTGIVASAALSVFLAGSERVAVGQTLYMSHGSWTSAVGHAVDLAESLDVLQKWDAQSVDYMAARLPHLDRATIEGWHDGRDHWFDPWEAADLGIVTMVVDAERPEPAKSITEDRQQAIAAKSAQRAARDQVQAVRRTLETSLAARFEPRPAAEAAKRQPESRPAQRAAQTESDRRFERWRRLQDVLDRQFAAALSRNAKIKATCGIELKQPERLNAMKLL